MRSVFYFYDMRSFIFDVLKELKSKKHVISELTFILPSKRAGLFLKKELASQNKAASFLPEIISIESFVEELSQLRPLNSLETLFEFYTVYQNLTPKKETEDFDRFSKWASTVLQDFNEIDRHLIPPEKLFNYLSAIQEINHWSLEPNPTKMVKSYLKFWKQIYNYYIKFSEHLLLKNSGYQGLIYKIAVQNLEAYLQHTKRRTHIFIGFNALNAAEALIVQELLQQSRAQIFWDADTTFLESAYHDAGLFMRRYKQQWPYYKSKTFQGIASYYVNSKNIHITGASKQIGQVKYTGELLSALNSENKLENTALILADESLLLPVLNALPPEIAAVNITMGLPLFQIPLASFIDQWLKLHSKNTATYYYKDVVNILSHPFATPLFLNSPNANPQKIIQAIKRQNLTTLSLDTLLTLSPTNKGLLKLLFERSKSPKNAIEQMIKLLFNFKDCYTNKASNNGIALEYIYRFLELFQQIQNYDSTYNVIDSIKTLQGVFKDLLRKETLDFKGEPLKGLQIMGMLESRVLDFETVVIVSVNEGILPAGKTNNSFIPFDVKLENNLPTHKEKDAIYTYHFYRLLHRAKNIHLIYNTEPDVLKGGEPSRFIAQLELENKHHCQHQILIPKLPSINNSLQRINKTDAILESLRDLAAKGFSPSSLGQYIRNPIDFYSQKILGIREDKDLEETVEATTFGSVIHYTLESFYKPFVGQALQIEKLQALKPKIDSTVRRFFMLLYKKGNISSGKNLISFEVAKRYISNFLDHEIQGLRKGHKIVLEAVEKPVKIQLEYPELDFPICFKGSIDRIDRCDGIRRIIDYKTSKVEQKDLNLVHWRSITEDYKKHNKSFQVLMYAYILNLLENNEDPLEAGVISFKNLKAGVLKFTKKDRVGRGAQKQSKITLEMLASFETELKALLCAMFDMKTEFLEKEV